MTVVLARNDHNCNDASNSKAAKHAVEIDAIAAATHTHIAEPAAGKNNCLPLAHL